MELRHAPIDPARQATNRPQTGIQHAERLALYAPRREVEGTRGRMGTDAKEVLTTTEAAELLQISTKTLLRLAREGALPGNKLGRSWRFARRDLLGRLSGVSGT